MDAVAASSAGLQSEMAGVRAALDSLRAEVGRLSRQIDGNGKPALQERVSMLEIRLEPVEEICGQVGGIEKRMYAAGAILTAFVALAAFAADLRRLMAGG